MSSNLSENELESSNESEDSSSSDDDNSSVTIGTCPRCGKQGPLGSECVDCNNSRITYEESRADETRGQDENELSRTNGNRPQDEHEPTNKESEEDEDEESKEDEDKLSDEDDLSMVTMGTCPECDGYDIAGTFCVNCEDSGLIYE